MLVYQRVIFIGDSSVPFSNPPFRSSKEVDGLPDCPIDRDCDRFFKEVKVRPQQLSNPWEIPNSWMVFMTFMENPKHKRMTGGPSMT